MTILAKLVAAFAALLPAPRVIYSLDAWIQTASGIWRGSSLVGGMVEGILRGRHRAPTELEAP